MWRWGVCSTGRRDGGLVLAVLVAVGLAGCSSTEALTPAAFRAKANSECRALQQASNELANAADPSATGQKVTGFVSDAAAILRKRVTTIGALAAPDELATQRDELVSTLQRYADLLEQLGEQAKAGQSFTDLQSDHQDTIARLNELATEASTAAVELELTECLAGVP